MKTWRERIVEARERGRWTPYLIQYVIGSLGFLIGRPWPFTRDDLETWQDSERCLAGEVSKAYVITWPHDAPLFNMGMDALDAIATGNVARLERVLDRMEDRALELMADAALTGIA